MRKLRSFIKLTRIEHGLFVGLVPLSTYVLTSSHINILTLLVLYFTALLAEIYLFTLNDLCNIAEDRINRPEAPLVKGEITIFEAKLITFISLIAGLIIIALAYIYNILNTISLIVYIVAIILGTLYNIRLKRVCLIGNILTSLTTSLSFLYGMERLSMIPLLLFATSFIACLGREVIKTIIDIEGDRVAGLSTLPIKYGIDISRKVAIGSEVTASGLLLLLAGYVFSSPLLMNRFFILASCCIVVSILNVISLFKVQDYEKLRRTLLKLMFILILSYLVNALFLYLSGIY
ncbi:MAG: UbiA family prenyltransferase [Crenarchaeota archaeon]|nr:UbiA family prenyltransferase [Thermoproteota archaeon]